MPHVQVGKAIDWSQWQLDRSVRSLRMQTDRDNDLYAVPVVVVDPTGDMVTANPGVVKTPWMFQATSVSTVLTDVHVPPAGKTSYLTQIEINHVGETSAVPQQNMIGVSDFALFQWLYQWWMVATASHNPAYNITFEAPLVSVDGFQIIMGVALTSGDMAVNAWGYDA
jgi:hypothetical protein